MATDDPFKRMFERLYEELDCCESESESELHKAAEEGNVEMVVKFLQDNPSEINLEDDTGNTPLCIATKMGHLAVVHILLRHSASINSSEINPMH